MMKKRRAFLIGGRYLEPLNGVNLDIEAWRSFLQTSMGGCWRSDEVIDLSGKSKDVALEEIKSAQGYFYTMVIFAGHGEVRKDKYGFMRTYVLLNDNEELSEFDLNPGNSRATLIMDCCRNVRRGLVKESMESLLSITSLLNGVNTRTVYENAIENCESGLVKVFSADVGQSAADEDSFLRTLIEAFQDLYLKNAFPGLLTIKNAVSLAATMMSPQQKPVYCGGRRLHHYPLAIHPMAY